MVFIINSNRKREPNWSGKEFSKLPAKIYQSLQSCTDALAGYWYAENPIQKADHRQIIITPLTEAKEKKLLEEKKIRW